MLCTCQSLCASQCPDNAGGTSKAGGLCPGCQEKTEGQFLFFLYQALVLRPATKEELFAIPPRCPSVER